MDAYVLLLRYFGKPSGVVLQKYLNIKIRLHDNPTFHLSKSNILQAVILIQTKRYYELFLK